MHDFTFWELYFTDKELNSHAHKAQQNKPGICELWNSFAVDDDTVAHNYSAERRQEKV
jgi:uncharacterized Zn-finger protein